MQASFFESKTDYYYFISILKNRLQLIIGDSSFSKYFEDLEVTEVIEGTVYLKLSNPSFRVHINRYYDKVLKACKSTAADILSLNIHKVNFDVKEPLVDVSNIQGNIIPLPYKNEFSSPVNADYRFDNFVVADSNSLCFSIAKSLANSCIRGKKTDGIAANLFFMYGHVGNGKTHLLHSIANSVQKAGKTALYFSAERFLFSFVKSLRENSINKFKETLLNADILLIDDLHFIVNKKSTLEEIYHITRTLVGEGKFVVFSSSISPYKLDFTPNVNKEFFTSGLMAMVSNPDLSLRIKILELKARQLNFEISDELISFLASSCQTNVRELEGVLNKLYANCKILNKNINYELVNDLLNEILAFNKKIKQVSIQEISTSVTQYLNINTDEVMSNTRAKNIIEARQIIMFIASEITDLNVVDIARFFKKRSHGTVLHAIKTTKEKLKIDQKLFQAISEITESLKY